MANGVTNFPGALDTTTNLPTTRATGGGDPPTDHNNLAAAVLAIETLLGTGSATPVRAGANSTITSLTGLTTPLSTAQGGTGTTTGKVADRIVTASGTGTQTPNSATTDIYRLTLTGAVTLAVPSGTPSDAQKLYVECYQDSTGSRTITLSTSYYIPSTLVAPVLGTTPNSLNVLGFRYNGVLSKWVYYGMI